MTINAYCNHAHASLSAGKIVVGISGECHCFGGKYAGSGSGQSLGVFCLMMASAFVGRPFLVCDPSYANL
ncbi:hypothetical protein [Desulfoplanes sp.]